MSNSLWRFRRLLDTMERMGGDDAAWFGTAARIYLAGASDGLTLDQALGLRPKPGQRKWWTAEALRRRDSEFRRVYRTMFPDLTEAEAARAIHELLPTRGLVRPVAA